MTTMKELTTKEMPSWCPACGDFNILFAIKNALAEINVERENIAIVSGIGCLPPDEMVSLGNEWKAISSVENGQIVNGEGKFADIAFRTMNKFEGDMLSITPSVSPFNSIRLTPSHPVYAVKRNAIRARNQVDKRKLENAEPHFMDAGELRKGDCMVFNWNREVKDNDAYTEDFCRLLGYYLAEGWIGEGGGRNRDGANVSFALNSDEKDIIEEISGISLKLTGRKPYIRERKEIGKVTEVTICSKELALRLKSVAGKGAGKKKIIEDVMLLPAEKQKHIIETYMKGDGCTGRAKLGKNDYVRASTLSVDLAIQMQELLARQGIFASLYVKKMKPHILKGRVIKPSGNQICIAYQSKKVFSQVQKTKYGFLVPIKTVTKSPYKGLVYNFEMKENPHSYLVRGFVTHNCGSKTPHFVNTYGFEGLHGRAMPVATGIKLANKGLKVIVVSGDGDSYGIGGNHLIHGMRRNLDITYLVQNNAVYGLTKGQYSPTSMKGFKTPTSLGGAIEESVNPTALALTMGATYVARGYAYEVKHLQKLIVDGINHKGFSFIDIFQPCSTYNKIQTISWYKEHLVKMEEIGHDPSNFDEAMKKAWMKEKLPIGLFFKNEKPTYEEQVPAASVPLVKQDISNIDIKPLLQRFK